MCAGLAYTGDRQLPQEVVLHTFNPTIGSAPGDTVPPRGLSKETLKVLLIRKLSQWIYPPGYLCPPCSPKGVLKYTAASCPHIPAPIPDWGPGTARKKSTLLARLPCKGAGQRKGARVLRSRPAAWWRLNNSKVGQTTQYQLAHCGGDSTPSSRGTLPGPYLQAPAATLPKS